MADPRSTPLSFARAVWLCLLLLLATQRFKTEERNDQAARDNYKTSFELPHRADVVRRAFLSSLFLVLAFSLIGFSLGRAMQMLGRCATPETTVWAQAIGAALLLWGTLFVRGWEIQSYSGVQLTERVNQWLYRFLYCVGTAIIVYSLSFPQCREVAANWSFDTDSLSACSADLHAGQMVERL